MSTVLAMLVLGGVVVVANILLLNSMFEETQNTKK